MLSEGFLAGIRGLGDFFVFSSPNMAFDRDYQIT